MGLALVQACLLLMTSHVAGGGPRSALVWLVPYTNLTSIADYEAAWHQWKAHFHPGLKMAGSAYAAKVNGSLGYADTTAGEGKAGWLMETYGFPALKNLGYKPMAMVYVTHFEAIQKITADPQPFIQQLLHKAQQHGLAGFDLDYEPQQAAGAGMGSPAGSGWTPHMKASFMGLLDQLSQAMVQAGLELTIDIGSCPSFHDFACSEGYSLPAMSQVIINCG